MKPVLVTGASGLFGGEVARQLVSQGVPVRLFVRDATRSPQFGSGNSTAPVEIVVGDYMDRAALTEAMTGIEKMFLASYDHSQAVNQQANVLGVAKQCGLRHVVRLSSDSAEQNRHLPIFHWHEICERQLEDSGLAFTHLRPAWVMQNFESFVVDDCIRLPCGDGRIGLVDHRDVAAVAVAALTTTGHEGRGYVLATESLSHVQVAEFVSQATGRPIRYLDIPVNVYQRELESAGWEKPSIDSMLGLFEDLRAGRNHDSDVADSVMELLGRPGIRFAQYARDYADRFGCQS